MVSKFAAVGVSESLAHDLQLTGAAIGVSVLCPSLVATAIGRSDRNAPRGLHAGEPSADVEMVDQALLDSTTKEGMSPDEVAAIVIEAVRSGQFYIGTKPSFDAQVRQRTDAVLARQLPPIPDID